MRWMALREHQLMNMDFIWYEQVPTDMNFQIAPLKTFLFCYCPDFLLLNP